MASKTIPTTPNAEAPQRAASSASIRSAGEEHFLNVVARTGVMLRIDEVKKRVLEIFAELLAQWNSPQTPPKELTDEVNRLWEAISGRRVESLVVFAFADAVEEAKREPMQQRPTFVRNHLGRLYPEYAARLSVEAARRVVEAPVSKASKKSGALPLSKAFQAALREMGLSPASANSVMRRIREHKEEKRR